MSLPLPKLTIPSPPSLTRLTNAYLVLPSGSLTPTPSSLTINTTTGTIIAIGEHAVPVDKEVDLQGAIVGPGLIDIQINGAFGVDFSDYEVEEEEYVKGLGKVARGLLQTGVTAFVPTIISQVPEAYKFILPLLTPLSTSPTSPSAAHILGYHLEGPFLSPSKVGCHPPANLVSAPQGLESMEEVYGIARDSAVGEEGVRIVTLAPEVEGVGECVRMLGEGGWCVSMGHSAATTAQANQAVLDGARLITHLFNAMPQLHHREPGLIGLLGLPSTLCTPTKRDISQLVHSAVQTPLRGTMPSTPPGKIVEELERRFPSNEDERRQVERPWYSIIADGVHVHSQAVAFAYRAHEEGCILVTDAVQLLDPNLPDGTYHWRDLTSIRKCGASITVSGTDTLAGAATTLDQCVRNLCDFASIPLSKAIQCASANPAKCLGGKVAARKGVIAVGMDADLSVWDGESRKVIGTWVMGKEVYSAV